MKDFEKALIQQNVEGGDRTGENSGLAALSFLSTSTLEITDERGKRRFFPISDIKST